MFFVHECKYYRYYQTIMYREFIVILAYQFQENKSYCDKPFAFILWCYVTVCHHHVWHMYIHAICVKLVTFLSNRLMVICHLNVGGGCIGLSPLPLLPLCLSFRSFLQFSYLIKYTGASKSSFWIHREGAMMIQSATVCLCENSTQRFQS